MADPERLLHLATLAVPRERLQAEGYRAVCASSDLHRHGYTVRHWFRFPDGPEVLEYLPYTVKGKRWDGRPRLTAATWEEQAAIHLALGLNLVGPGERWKDYGGRGLFDGMHLAEAGDER